MKKVFFTLLLAVGCLVSANAYKVTNTATGEVLYDSNIKNVADVYSANEIIGYFSGVTRLTITASQDDWLGQQMEVYYKYHQSDWAAGVYTANSSTWLKFRELFPDVEELTIDGGNLTSQCFGFWESLNSVIVKDANKIYSQAFQNCKNIRSVVVTNEDRFIPCEKGAFDFDITVGQTSEANFENNLATLTYPEKYDDPYYYENNYQNLKYRDSVYQWNILDYLTQQSSDQLKGQNATNGWQEFLSTGSRKVIASKAKEAWRTFSNTVATRFPSAYMKENTEFCEVYFVIGVDSVFDHYDYSAYKKVYKYYWKLLLANKYEECVIPANTGVLIHYKGVYLTNNVSGNKEKPYAYRGGNSSTCQAVKYKYDGKTYHAWNYLESMQDIPQEAYPIYMDWNITSKNEKFIGFFLDDIDDEWNFYTILGKEYTYDDLSYRAYLRLPRSLYPTSVGNVISSQETSSENEVSSAKSYTMASEASEVVDTEEYPEMEVVTNLLPVIDENGEQATTSIDDVTTVSFEDNKYYNLQGVEVKTPSKGVYIYNGKKVVLD